MYVDTLSRLDQVAFTAFFALVSLSSKLNVKLFQKIPLGRELYISIAPHEISDDTRRGWMTAP